MLRDSSGGQPHVVQLLIPSLPQLTQCPCSTGAAARCLDLEKTPLEQMGAVSSPALPPPPQPCMFSAGLSPAQLISAASEACRNGSKVLRCFSLGWSALGSKNPALKLGELHVADNSCREAIFREQCSAA